MQGWIKLHRELIDKPIWLESTPEQKTILITLLMMASHQEKKWEWKGNLYIIEPGQFITSLESIVKKCGKGVSIQNVRTALKRFEKYEFLTNQPTNKNRLITIVNWGVYQSDEEETNKQTNKQLTSNQQATNNYQEVKNVKNANKKIYIDLPINDHDFLRIYNQQFFNKFHKNHMRVSEEQKEFILGQVSDIELWNDLDNEAFEEIVTYHFDNLPPKNNGNILAFFHAFPRYLQMLRG